MLSGSGDWNMFWWTPAFQLPRFLRSSIWVLHEPLDLRGLGVRGIAVALCCWNKMGPLRIEVQDQDQDETCGPRKTWSSTLGSSTIDGAWGLGLGTRMSQSQVEFRVRHQDARRSEKNHRECTRSLRAERNNTFAARFNTSANLAPSPKMEKLRPKL